MSIHDERIKAAKQIEAAVKEGNLVVFVGAGISAGQIPTANEIQKDIFNKLIEHSDVDRACIIKDGQERALRMQFEHFNQHLHEIVGDKLVDIFNAYMKDKMPTEAICILCELMKQKKIKKVITVNFDELIELQYGEEKLTVVVDNEVHSKKEDQSGLCKEAPVLYKLHGTIGCPDSVIGTLFREGGELPRESKDILNRIFMKHFVWFVGYNMFDYDVFRYLIKRADEDNGNNFKGLIFNLYTGEKSERIKELERRMVYRGQVRKVWFTKGDAAVRLKDIENLHHMIYVDPSCANDKLPIIQEQALLLLGKFGAVRNTILKNNNKQTAHDNVMKLEYLHQIAQNEIDPSKKEQLYQDVFSNAESLNEGNIEYNEHYLMRLKTIKIESKRLELKLQLGAYTYEDKQTDLNNLCEKANGYKKEEENKHYKEHFEILYYRCTNLRAMYYMRSKDAELSISNPVFKYLEDFKAHLVGDISVNIFAFCFLFLIEKDIKYLKLAKIESMVLDENCDTSRVWDHLNELLL